MLIIRGVNIYPSQVEAVLLEIEESRPYYQLIVCRDGTLDELEVQVEVSEQYFTGESGVLDTLKRHMSKKIAGALGVGVSVTPLRPKTLERGAGKARRVIDTRHE